jgi:hypothetical protein
MQLTLVDSGDLKAISKALRHHADGKQLRKELMVELKQAAAPIVPKVQAAWRSAPAFGGRKSRANRSQPDLRELLARSTWVQARLTGKEAGVRVRTDGRKMPSGMKALPRLAEGLGHSVDRRAGRWRHPVYGDRDTWVSQQPFPRFYQAIGDGDDLAARRAVNQAVDKVFDQIERAT